MRCLKLIREDIYVPIECILFDFDGTLAKLTIDFSLIRREIIKLAKKYYCYLPLEEAPILEMVEALKTLLAEKDPHLGNTFFKESHNIIRSLEIAAARKGVLFDFTRPLLKKLLSEDIKIAIVTRNCEEAVKIVFPDIHTYCHIFLPREAVTKVKPSPEHILTAVRFLKATVETTLFVGDHPLDIQAGINAGTWTGGVTTGRSTFNDLKKAGAHWIAEDCCHLLNSSFMDYFD